MTAMNERKEKVGHFLFDEGLKWLARMAFLALGLIVVALFTPYWDQGSAVWRSPQTSSRIEQKIEVMGDRIEDLTNAVNRASGNDRVIRQPRGLTYVSEPVTVGDPVTLNLVIFRTELGQGCILRRGQSLFTDSQNITTAGSEIIPRRQVGGEQTRLRVVIDPPETLMPGRVELYLALEYDCGGRTQFDRTEIVTYELMPAG